jgi:hypothetical protein
MALFVNQLEGVLKGWKLEMIFDHPLLSRNYSRFRFKTFFSLGLKFAELHFKSDCFEKYL